MFMRNSLVGRWHSIFPDVYCTFNIEVSHFTYHSSPLNKSLHCFPTTPKGDSLRREKLTVDRSRSYRTKIRSHRDNINRKPPTTRRERRGKVAGGCNSEKATAPCPQGVGSKMHGKEPLWKRTIERWLSHSGKSPQLLSAFEILRSVDLGCPCYQGFLGLQGGSPRVRGPQTRCKRRTRSPYNEGGYGTSATGALPAGTGTPLG